MTLAVRAVYWVLAYLGVVVAPLGSPGLYWPQPGAAFGPGQGGHRKGFVFLGEGRAHVGDEFRLLLVVADEYLDARFRHAPPGGLRFPVLDGLSRAEVLVRRDR